MMRTIDEFSIWLTCTNHGKMNAIQQKNLTNFWWNQNKVLHGYVSKSGSLPVCLVVKAMMNLKVGQTMFEQLEDFKYLNVNFNPRNTCIMKYGKE